MSDIKSFKDWNGEMPDKCDMCKAIIEDTFIDGRTIHGPWAIMCPTCFKVFGTGLGIGKGQMYIKEVIKSDRHK